MILGKFLKEILFIIASLALWNCCNFKTSENSNLEFPLPLNLKAVYYGSDVQYPILGLVIIDDLNFVIVGKNDEFIVNGDSVEVEKITKIGIGDYKVFIEFRDTQNEIFYIECTKRNNNKVNQAISLITFDNVNMLNQDSIKWIEADDVLKTLKIQEN